MYDGAHVRRVMRSLERTNRELEEIQKKTRRPEKIPVVREARARLERVLNTLVRAAA